MKDFIVDTLLLSPFWRAELIGFVILNLFFLTMFIYVVRYKGSGNLAALFSMLYQHSSLAFILFFGLIPRLYGLYVTALGNVFVTETAIFAIYSTLMSMAPLVIEIIIIMFFNVFFQTRLTFLKRRLSK
ncbi:hypothetical protein K1X84_10475 [bacterium]|nr:hypothetical protein [bacterium]